MGQWLQLDLPYGIGANIVLPVAALRGAVFSSVVYRGRTIRPVYTKKTLIAEYGHVRMYQTAGAQLDQGDADVYAELAKLAMQQNDPDEKSVTVKLHAHALLQAMGRPRGTESLKWLAGSISRLKQASYLYELPDGSEWECSFVTEVVKDTRPVHVTAAYTIDLSQSMLKVFDDGWRLIRTDQRKKLHRDPLAKHLHAFYATHVRPGPISIERIRSITGRASVHVEKVKGDKDKTINRDKRWRDTLAESLANLKTVTGWYKCEIVGSNVVVHRTKEDEKAVKEREEARKASNQKAKPVPQPVQQEKKAPDPWACLYSEKDLERQPLQALLGLMDSDAMSEWDAFLDGDPNAPMDARKKKAVELLMPQLAALQAQREEEI